MSVHHQEDDLDLVNKLLPEIGIEEMINLMVQKQTV